MTPLEEDDAWEPEELGVCDGVIVSVLVTVTGMETPFEMRMEISA